MANYITDSGNYNYDATFTGIKGTNYDYSTTDECVWFDGSTGDASTGYTLPDSEWLVIEVYDMTGVAVSNTLGGTHLHGAKEFTVEVGSNVVTTLNNWRTAYHTAKGSTYITYDIIATHYKGSDLADTYEADEITAFASTTITDGDFTDHGTTWLISDDLLADSVSTLPDTLITSIVNVVNDDETTSYSDFTIYGINIQITAEGTNGYRPWIKWELSGGYTTGNTYRLGFDITQQDGVDDLILSGISMGGTLSYPADTLTVANGYTYDVEITTNSNNNLILYLDGRETFDAIFANLYIEDLGVV